MDHIVVVVAADRIMARWPRCEQCRRTRKNISSVLHFQINDTVKILRTFLKEEKQRQDEGKKEVPKLDLLDNQRRPYVFS
jgi:hypothetical protein